MKIAVFSTRSYDREFLSAAAAMNESFNRTHRFFYHDVHLRPETLLLAKGCESICAFVNDQLDGAVLADLKRGGTRLVALRCGYNNVDLITAKELGIPIVRVTAYSPKAVAENTVALNRKI